MVELKLSISILHRKYFCLSIFLYHVVFGLVSVDPCHAAQQFNPNLFLMTPS